MKKKGGIILVVCLTLFTIIGLTACGNDVDFTVNFIVEGESYATISTAGNETIAMPDNPTKNGYSFDGWYWDEGVWQTPFTANSLLDAPLSSDMSVYAKFTHIHADTDWRIVETTAATEESEGNILYRCAVCGATKTETIDKLPHVHVYSQDWKNDETHHWHECAKDGDKSGYAQHEWNSGTITKDATENETGAKRYTCTVCGYWYEENTPKLVIDRTGAEILTANDFTMNGNVGSLILPNTTEAYSFINQITVSEYATWVISTDIYGMNTIITRTIPLNIGDNTVYLLVSSGDGNNINLYTMTVRRRPMYTVNFVTNGGTSVRSQTIEETFFATEPTTTRTGYTFAGWNYDFNDPIIQNTTISASWSANTDTAYTVEYYLQNLENNNYTLQTQETEHLTGTTDATANAEIKSYEHFTYNQNASTASGNINGDGSRVLKVYYTRDRYDYFVVNENVKGGTITCTSNGIYKYDTTITLSTSINAGYDFLGWYVGDTQISGNTNYSFSIEQPIAITAKWYVHEDTDYKVEYYLQNLEDDNYTLQTQETEHLTGTTDTTANAEIKSYEHFTYNQNASTASGNINGDGSRVLKVYYTRDRYDYFVVNENVKGGSITCTSNGKYKYDTPIALSASVNAGYDLLGWYIGDTPISENVNYSFSIEQPITITIKWYAHENTAYKVEYYLQNLENDDYTIQTQETEHLTGTTDTTANAEIKSYEHFTYNQNASTASGNINGDGSCVLKVYYTRKTYTIIIFSDENSSIDNAMNASYKYGTTISRTIATPFIGYDFIGWYKNEEKLTETTTLARFTVQEDATYYTQTITKKEMMNFVFASSLTTCSIANIVDKTVSDVIVPDYVSDIGSSAFSGCSGLTGVTIGNGVTSIGNNAFYNCSSLTSITIPDSVTSIGSSTFSGCSSLESITIPFVGNRAGVTNSDTYQYPLGYLFGTSRFTGGTATTQYYYVSYTSSTTYNTYYNTYYIPASLKSVTVTGGYISYGAFYACGGLTSITLSDSVTSIGERAFYNCSSLTSITIGNSVTSIGSDAFYNCYSHRSVYYTGDVASWCGISFGNDYSNPLYYAGNLYIDNELVTEIVIPDSVTSIGDYAFQYCGSLTSITIPNSVTSIGNSAFQYCGSLTSITIPNSVTSIGDSAFSGCSNLTGINYTGDIASWCGISFSNNYSNPLYYTHNLYIYNELVTEIVIPDTVIEIKDYAFYECRSLTSITIPDSVTSIGERAFYNCRGLTNITIPDSVTSIGDLAFYNCTSLTSVTLSDSVTSIGSSAFSGCSSLTSITIPFVGNRAGVTSSDTYQFPLGYLFGTSEFTGGTSTKQYYYGSSTSSTTYNTYYIPTLLKSVTVTGGYIPYGAFYNCSSLTSVTLGNSVTSIGGSSFSNCTSLTSITIGNSVTIIREDAFYNCSSLTSVYYTGDIASWCGISFSNYASNPLYYAHNLYINNELVTEIVIPDSVTSIGSSAFGGCSKLTSITIGNGVTSIGSSAFGGCSKLTSITIGNGVTSIGSSAFGGCSSLTSITIPDSVTSIGSSTFSGCSSLTSISIPDSVTSIGERAFFGCSKLTSITIGNSVTSIGYDAFFGCSSLTSVYYTGDIASWCWISFSNVTSNPLSYAHNLHINNELVTEIVIPDTVTEIKAYAFYGWNGTNITIPDSVTSIGEDAFNRCSNLTSITIPDSVTSIGGEAFRGCGSLTSITIPDSVTSIGGFAFSGCSSLTSITIPFVGNRAGVTSSDTYQFPLGYLFGTSEFTGGTSTKQYYYGSSTSSTTYNTYYIPTSLKSVTVTGGYIPYGAFEKCNKLTSITIPDSVTSIGNYAFYYCTSLTSITIPDSVTSIGGDAFYHCGGLTSVYYTGDIASWCGISFGYNSNPLQYAHNLYINNELVTEIVIPDTVTEIKAHSFSGWNGTSVTIPDIVTSIGSYAFGGCSSLTSITIPDSVTSIGYSAFSGCSLLTSIMIPFVGNRAGVTSDDTYQYPFGYLFGTDSYTGGTATAQSYYGSSTSSTTSTTYYIPTTLKSVTVTGGYIPYGTFYACGGLTSVMLGDSVTSIGNSAFYNCTSLTSINHTGDIASWCRISFSNYASNPLYYAHNLYINNELVTEIVIPNTVTEIKNSAFSGWNGRSITIPDSVTSIGRYAFYNCASLTSVTIGNSVTSIGKDAFDNCSSLTCVYYSGDIASWCGISFVYSSSNPLYYAHNLYINNELVTEIVIPDTVTEIKAYAFHGWNGTNITIPDSVTSIGEHAFYYCTSLTSVTIGNSVTSIGNSAFYNCASLTSVTIGNSVTSIGNQAFYNCTSLTSITIPDSVMSIGDEAFCGCSSLTRITFAGTKGQWNAIKKGDWWNDFTGSYIIKCTDGDIVEY